MTPSPDAGSKIATADPLNTTHRYKQILPWLGLCAILMVYAGSVARLKPTNFFGLAEDDSIYFSSAQALAEGRGYILPSVPGAPRATKYPVLYSWLLSWIWRGDPSFPANLAEAVALNVVFGFAFLAAAFLFLRRLGGLSDAEVLFLTAFCALHPFVLFYTSNLIAEIPFAALSLSAIVLAGKTIRGERETASAAASGILSGLSILMRVLGAPIAVGLYLAILVRKGWRKSVYFAAGALPFFAVWFWRSMALGPEKAPISVSSCARAWQTTWLYYTSYLGFWKADALENHAIWHLLKENLIVLLIQPGNYLVDPGLVRVLAAFASVPAVVLSAGAIRGGLLVRTRNGYWQPAHYALFFYVLPILMWNYSLAERFLIPFLPFFVGAIWLEGRLVIERMQASLRAQGLKKEGFAIVVLCLAIVGLMLGVALSFERGLILVRQNSERRGEILIDKREAYAWLRQNSASNAKVIAYEDASAYLYSHRQAMRPLIFSPGGSFRPEKLESELCCITAGARMISAEYWLIADDDFDAEWEPAITLGRAREKHYEEVLPQVFRGGHGRVRIYRFGCAEPGSGPYPILNGPSMGPSKP